MNWDAIAAVGQSLSALALVAVFIQVRQARHEMHRSILESRQNVGRELDLFRAGNERLGKIRAKANAALLNAPHPVIRRSWTQRASLLKRRKQCFMTSSLGLDTSR